MSELITTNGICPSFSKSEIEIVNSSNTSRILNLSTEEIYSHLSDSISNAILVVGNKSLDASDVSIIIQQIASYLKENNQYDKIGEIKQAIRNGSFGRYKKENDVLYISPANVVKWITDYKAEVIETLSKQSKFEIEVLAKQEEAEKDMKANEKYWIDLPKNIAEATEGNKMSSIYFENLWKLDLLKLSKEEIEVLKRNARKKAIDVLKHKKRSLIKIGEDNITNMANKLAKEKAFHLWIKDNQENDIEKIVRDAIDSNKNI